MNPIFLRNAFRKASQSHMLPVNTHICSVSHTSVVFTHLFANHQRPMNWISARYYDKKKYKQQKELARKAKKGQTTLDIDDCVQTMRTYSFGQQLPLMLHVKTQKSADSSKKIKGQVEFPHSVQGESKQLKTLVFATGAHAELAKKLGATYVGGEELIAQITKGEIEADRCFSTKQMFPKLIKAAKVLGPKGLMPSPARGTVSDDLTSLLKKQDAATAFVAGDDGVITIKVGETTWEPRSLLGNLQSFSSARFIICNRYVIMNGDSFTLENMRAVYQAILALQPAKLKGSFVDFVSLSVEQTPALSIPTNFLQPKKSKAKDIFSV